MTVKIEHDRDPPNAAPTKDWDVVVAAQNVSEPFDWNALKFNPRWKWQTIDQAAKDFDHDCPSIDDVTDCTTQGPQQDQPRHRVIASFGGCPNGHLNWEVVSYRGQIFWQKHDWPDDDYNFLLHTPQTPPSGFRSGVTKNNLAGIKLEFKAAETIDHFDNIRFWKQFHDAVDNHNSSWINDNVNRNDAIVIGLLGLDRVHGSPSEIHPVFALAIHTLTNPSNDTWAIFVRNSGNEGWCSTQQHRLVDFEKITLRLPRPSTVPPAARAVQGVNTKFMANKDGLIAPEVFSAPNQDTLVTFHLPPAPENPCTFEERLRPGCAPTRWSGELHLEWPLVTSASGAVVTAPRVLQTAQQDPEDAADTGDPEEAIEDLFAQLTPEQQADFQAILPPVPEALPDSVLVIPRFVDSPPAPASVPPKSVAVFDPTQPQRMNDIVMSFCGATHGQLASDLFSCMPGDLDGSGEVDCDDIAIIKAAFGRKRGQTGFDLRSDVNGDGVIDAKDLASVAQKLPAGTRCQ